MATIKIFQGNSENFQNDQKISAKKYKIQRILELKYLVINTGQALRWKVLSQLEDRWLELPNLKRFKRKWEP